MTKNTSNRSKMVVCVLSATLMTAIIGRAETPAPQSWAQYENMVLNCINNPECRLESLFDVLLAEKNEGKQWKMIRSFLARS